MIYFFDLTRSPKGVKTESIFWFLRHFFSPICASRPRQSALQRQKLIVQIQQNVKKKEVVREKNLKKKFKLNFRAKNRIISIYFSRFKLEFQVAQK